MSSIRRWNGALCITHVYFRENCKSFRTLKRLEIKHWNLTEPNSNFSGQYLTLIPFLINWGTSSKTSLDIPFLKKRFRTESCGSSSRRKKETKTGTKRSLNSAVTNHRPSCLFTNEGALGISVRDSNLYEQRSHGNVSQHSGNALELFSIPTENSWRKWSCIVLGPQKSC